MAIHGYNIAAQMLWKNYIIPRNGNSFYYCNKIGDKKDKRPKISTTQTILVTNMKPL